jgi:hypothetical protein
MKCHRTVTFNDSLWLHVLGIMGNESIAPIDEGLVINNIH